MSLAIRLLGDPVLRRRTRPVEHLDADVAAFARELIEAMYVADGVGLAAPQVGDERRIAVIDVSEERVRTEAIVLVNPSIVRRRGTMPSEEGCLSIPGIVETIERAEEVEVEYTDLGGQRHTIVGRELLSRVLQHEIDHLDGILFIDHLGALKREMVVKEWQRLKAEAERERAREA